MKPHRHHEARKDISAMLAVYAAHSPQNVKEVHVERSVASHIEPQIGMDAPSPAREQATQVQSLFVVKLANIESCS